MSMVAHSKSRELLIRIMLVVVSTLVTLFAFEITVRMWRGTLTNWSNLVVNAHRPESFNSGVIYDETLGSVPAPNFSRSHYHHDAEGFRTMPAEPGAASVLTLGDSFTYGIDVGDEETWPLYLQKIVHRRIVNAGVPGYGIDQDILRAELLVPRLAPKFVVLSFIADDVRRLEYSRLWDREKPYFELQNTTLLLRNTPVPHSPVLGSQLPAIERFMGWSALFDFARTKLVKDLGEYFGDHHRVLEAGTGERMICPLMKRLERVGVPVLVVAQYDPFSWERNRYGQEARRLSRLVLKCADQANLVTLDLFEPMERVIRTRGLDALYGAGTEHHNADGNRFVSELIAAEVQRRGIALLP